MNKYCLSPKAHHRGSILFDQSQRYCKGGHIIISTYHHPWARSTYIVIACTQVELTVRNSRENVRGGWDWGLVASTRHTVNQFGHDWDDSHQTRMTERRTPRIVWGWENQELEFYYKFMRVKGCVLVIFIRPHRGVWQTWQDKGRVSIWFCVYFNVEVGSGNFQDLTKSSLLASMNYSRSSLIGVGKRDQLQSCFPCCNSTTLVARSFI